MRYNLASREFIFENGACPECTTSECDEIQLNATIMKCSRSKMHANAHRSKNATGIECSRYRIHFSENASEFSTCRMQHVRECTRMQTNAPCPMHSECTDGNATQMQQPKRMQRVRNASEFYIMLQILNASRPKCNTNVSECIENVGMHDNAW